MQNRSVPSREIRRRPGMRRFLSRGAAVALASAVSVLLPAVGSAQDFLSDGLDKAGFSIPTLPEAEDVEVSADYMGADNATGTVSLLSLIHI